MSASPVNRNNVLAGVFVVASILLAILIASVLGDALDAFGSKREYTVRFPTTVGVTGLQPGADVTFAGMPVGKVTAISAYHPNGDDNPAAAMDVRIAVDTRVILYEDAYADLSPPLLGGVSTINFASPGSGAVAPDSPLSPLVLNNNDGRLDENETVAGRFAPSILAQLGFSVEDAERIRRSIADVELTAENARQITQRFEEISRTIAPDIESAMADARGAASDVRGFTTNLTAEGGWSQRVEGILDKAHQTLAEGPLIARDARDTIASAREMVEGNRAGVSEIIEHVRATAERVRFETMDQAEAMIDKGTLAVTSYGELADNANNILLQARPDVSVALANTRALSQQARLFLDEVRAQPWRLLKSPSESDLRREPLYAAARAYASAVADLRAASEALDTALTTGGSDAGRVVEIAQAVQAAYEGYDEAERALLATLRDATPE